MPYSVQSLKQAFCMYWEQIQCGHGKIVHLNFWLEVPSMHLQRGTG